MAVLGQAFIEIVPETGKFASKLGKDVKESVDKAEKETSGSFDKLANVGQKALLGVSTAAVTAGVFAVHMADEYEAAHGRLEVAVKNSGGSIESLSGRIRSQTSDMAKLGITSDQYEGALARLTQATNDPKKALDEMGLVANIAAARHIDLETAATLVGKVAQGNTGVLKRYGIDLGGAAGGAKALQTAHDQLNKATEALRIVEEKVHDGRLKGVAAADALKKAHEAVDAATTKVSASSTAAGAALAALSDRFGGSAAAQADTFQGKIKAVEAQGKNLAITVGLVLIPIIEKVGSVLLDGVQWLEQHRAALIAVGVVVGTVLVAAIGAYIATMVVAAATTLAAAAPFIAVAAAVALVAAGVVYLWGHFQVLQGFVHSLKLGFDAFRDGLTNGGPWEEASPFQKGLYRIGVIFREVFAAVRTAIQAFKDGFGNAGPWEEGSPFQKGMYRIGAIIREDVLPVLQEVTGWVSDHLTLVLVGLGVTIGLIVSPVLLVAAGIIYAYTHFQVFRDVVDAVVGFLVGSLWPTIQETARIVTSVFGVTFDVATVVWNAVGAVIRAFVNGPLAFIQEQIAVFSVWWDAHWSEISTVLNRTIDQISRVISVVFDGISTYFTVWWAIVSGVFKAALDVIVPTLAVAWEVIRGAVTVAWDAIRGVFAVAWDLIAGTFRVARDVILGVIGVFLDLVTGHWGKAWNDVKDLVTNVLHDVQSTVDHIFHAIVETIVSVAGDVFTAAGRIGKSIVDGIVDAIKNLAGDIGHALSGAVEGAVNGLPGGDIIKKGLHSLGFADGGWVPGAAGAPQLAVVHGGEYVLSRQMLAGAQSIAAGAGRAGGGGVSVAAGAVVVHQQVHGQPDAATLAEMHRLAQQATTEGMETFVERYQALAPAGA